MNPIVSVLDNGAGTNLIKYELLTEDMREKIEAHTLENLRSANKTELYVPGVITI